MWIARPAPPHDFRDKVTSRRDLDDLLSFGESPAHRNLRFRLFVQKLSGEAVFSLIFGREICRILRQSAVEQEICAKIDR